MFTMDETVLLPCYLYFLLIIYIILLNHILTFVRILVNAHFYFTLIFILRN